MIDTERTLLNAHVESLEDAMAQLVGEALVMAGALTAMTAERDALRDALVLAWERCRTGDIVTLEDLMKIEKALDAGGRPT